MKIVVCGGGTAGWLAAYILSMAQPNMHEITVIESSKIGIVGAGEASSGLLYDLFSGRIFIHNNPAFSEDASSFDMDDFMEKVGGVPKYGLKHINWAKEKGSYFAPVFGSETYTRSPDVLFNYAVSELGPEKAYMSSSIGHAYEMNKMPPAGGFAFQFDAFRVGAYIREHLKKTTDLTHIDAIIKKVNVSSAGNIESLLLDDGQTVDGDFFIDCTGFARVLAKELDMGWESYSKYLPVDRAMPFLTTYDESLKEKVEPITTAEALSSGWMWRTPLKHRRGNGYVYSSSFISESEAQAEVEARLDMSIEPLKHLKFDSGSLESVWKNNCLAVGLSASFIEPLEGTSIHSTVMQMLYFTQEYLTPEVEGTATETNAKTYNKKISSMFEYYRDFVVLHYRGNREDTDFWRFITNEVPVPERVQDYLERSKHKIPTALYFEDYWGVDALWKWTLAGLGYVSSEQAKKELLDAGLYEVAEGHYQAVADENLYLLSMGDKPFEVFPDYGVSL